MFLDILIYKPLQWSFPCQNDYFCSKVRLVQCQNDTCHYHSIILKSDWVIKSNQSWLSYVKMMPLLPGVVSLQNITVPRVNTSRHWTVSSHRPILLYESCRVRHNAIRASRYLNFEMANLLNFSENHQVFINLEKTLVIIHSFISSKFIKNWRKILSFKGKYSKFFNFLQFFLTCLILKIREI